MWENPAAVFVLLEVAQSKTTLSCTMQLKCLRLYLRLVKLFAMHKELVLTVIGLVALYETPSVHVNDLTFAAIIASKQVKATYALPETFGYLISPRLLFLREPGNEAGL
jgi:hypothetical protein